MKVFVTGANGLVGSFVVRLLLEQGFFPVLLLRKNGNYALIKDVISKCEIAEGDILDELYLEKCFASIDIVIHCAGFVSFNPSKNKEIFEVNVQGTTNIVNACIKCKVRKLIHVSSIAALGRNELNTTYNEESKWEDSRFNSSYAKSKYLAELEVYRGGEEGLDFSIVSPSVIIGPGDPSRSSTRLFDVIKKVKYLYPPGHLNVVDVRDVSMVICSFITIDHKEKIILNSGPITYRQFYEIVLGGRGLKISLIATPVWFIKLVAFLDKIKRIFVGGEPFITRENLKFLGRDFTYSSVYYNKIFNQDLISPEESIRNAAHLLGSGAK